MGGGFFLFFFIENVFLLRCFLSSHVIRSEHVRALRGSNLGRTTGVDTSFIRLDPRRCPWQKIRVNRIQTHLQKGLQLTLLSLSTSRSHLMLPLYPYDIKPYLNSADQSNTWCHAIILLVMWDMGNAWERSVVPSPPPRGHTPWYKDRGGALFFATRIMSLDRTSASIILEVKTKADRLYTIYVSTTYWRVGPPCCKKNHQWSLCKSSPCSSGRGDTPWEYGCRSEALLQEILSVCHCEWRRHRVCIQICAFSSIHGLPHWPSRLQTFWRVGP